MNSRDITGLKAGLAQQSAWCSNACTCLGSKAGTGSLFFRLAMVSDYSETSVAAVNSQHFLVVSKEHFARSSA